MTLNDNAHLLIAFRAADAKTWSVEYTRTQLSATFSNQEQNILATGGVVVRDDTRYVDARVAAIKAGL